MRVEIIDTGQILDVEPGIVLELMLNTQARVLEDDYNRKIDVDEWGNRIIELVCIDGIGMID